MRVKLFEDAIKNISENPQTGQTKTGDLNGIYVYGFNYKKIAYRTAYKIEGISAPVSLNKIKNSAG